MNPGPKPSSPPFTGFPPRGHDKCPFCSYSLIGLPNRHQCPECAFDYDEHTQVCIGRYALRSLLVSGLFFALCLLFAMPAVVDFATIGRLRPNVCSTVCLLMSILLIASWFRKLRNPPIAIVSPVGIHHRDSLARLRTIPWNDIHKVGVVNGFTGFELVVDHPDGERTCIRRVHAHKDELTLLCDDIRRRLHQSRESRNAESQRST